MEEHCHILRAELQALKEKDPRVQTALMAPESSDTVVKFNICFTLYFWLYLYSTWF